jgi:hypothetical protein
MNPKLLFGADYTTVMTVARDYSGNDSYEMTGFDLIDLLLCWDWGFSGSEVREVDNVFHENIRKSDIFEELPIATRRIVDHLATDGEAKKKFIINMMMFNWLDGDDVNDKEERFTVDFLEKFGFPESEFEGLWNEAYHRFEFLRLITQRRKSV